MLAVAMVGAAAAAAWWYASVWRPPIPARALVIGFEHNPPYQVRSPSGPPTGLVIDTVAEAARRAGIALVWQETTLGPERALGSGAVDLWPLVTDLPERRRILYISGPWLQSQHVLVLRAGTAVPERSFTGKSRDHRGGDPRAAAAGLLPGREGRPEPRRGRSPLACLLRRGGGSVSRVPARARGAARAPGGVRRSGAPGAPAARRPRARRGRNPGACRCGGPHSRRDLEPRTRRDAGSTDGALLVLRSRRHPRHVRSARGARAQPSPALGDRGAGAGARRARLARGLAARRPPLGRARAAGRAGDAHPLPRGVACGERRDLGARPADAAHPLERSDRADPRSAPAGPGDDPRVVARARPPRRRGAREGPRRAPRGAGGRGRGGRAAAAARRRVLRASGDARLPRARPVRTRPPGSSAPCST